MVILGFMLNYMLRVNMTIAIVSMVMPSNDTSVHSDSSDTSECFDRQIEANVTSFDDDGSTSKVDPDPAATSSSLYPVRATHEETNWTKYPWNEYQINLVLGSFFWGYVCTELPGGRLAEVVGPKRVFGYSMLVSSAITFLTPLSATYGYVAVVLLRTLLGFMLVGFPFAVPTPLLDHDDLASVVRSSSLIDFVRVRCRELPGQPSSQ
ncbi:unnamed protein product [Heterotrigona itama]|uniref:Major facilitator superfamily (MFS) profile domain-containing protein n=1 Tax=Heterotrigona itama TaxID=395501 RepID=A0A6V7HHN9_9HYME|nr:unnamed protein product [Heterotrigona itama]